MILSDEDVKALKLEVYGPYKCAVEVDALRTVLVKMTEAAVLEKLRQQKPVAEVARSGKRADGQPWHQGIFDEPGRMDLPSGTKLYTAPVPAAVPDSVVKQLEGLAKRCKAYQSAWDTQDLHKQLSYLAFEQAHGVEFEQAYSKITKQRDELLAALDAMLEYTADLDPMQGFEERDSAAVKQARAAIASVKGGA